MSRILILGLCFMMASAVSPFTEEKEIFSARSIGRSLAKCLGEPQVFACLQKETAHNLDLVLRDNSTWQYSDFIQFEKDTNFTLPNKVERSTNSIAEKLLQLAEARSIRLRVNPRSLEAETKDINPDEGGEDNTRKYQKIWYLNDSLKGRKKKDKDKGMAMFGGIAMVAMMAQMFLGKVMLIAGSAFVMAKIALMVSLLTSLKTKSSGGGNTEHVVAYTDAGGGGHSSGGGHASWHRSLPYAAQSTHIHEPVEQHSDPPDYYQYDTGTQRQDYKFI